MSNSNSKAGTEVPTSTTADVPTSSQTIAKPNVSSSATRFIVVDGSLSAHCCFGYTVIDKEAGKEDYGDYWKRTMCECFEEEEAKMICEALNKHYC